MAADFTTINVKCEKETCTKMKRRKCSVQNSEATGLRITAVASRLNWGSCSSHAYCQKGGSERRDAVRGHTRGELGI